MARFGNGYRPMYARILVATDGSDLGGKGLRHGLALAGALGARVLVLTVSEPWTPAFDDALALAGPGLQQQYRDSCAALARKVLADASARAAALGLDCETVYVADAYPADTIVDVARSRGADLVVMASHGRRGLGRVLLGSQTQAVLAQLELPVLVVR